MLNSSTGLPLSLAQHMNGAGRVLAGPLHQQLLQAKASLTPALQQAAPSAAPRPSSAVSRSGSMSETKAAPKSTPPPVQGAAAEGWKVSIKFRGNVSLDASILSAWYLHGIALDKNRFNSREAKEGFYPWLLQKGSRVFTARWDL